MSFCQDLPPHPFKNAPGVSQRNRSLAALDPAGVQIDSATLADRLLFVAEFARQVNFYHYDNTRQSIEADNWQRFFADSTPFLLARLAKTDIDALTLDLETLSKSVDALPEPENLRLLRDFVFSDLFSVLNDALYRLQEPPTALTVLWDNAIRTQLSEPLAHFVNQNKIFSKASGIPAPGFQKFTDSESWELDIQDLYALLPPGTNVAPSATLYRGIAQQFRQQGVAAILVLQQLTAEAASFLPDSLSPLEETYRQLHPPHLGLLFAFLQLFELFRDDLNGLSQQHLEYFFETVLHLSPRKARPDAAHLVLEVQKNLDRYLVKKGVAVKDGKDGRGGEVAFTLDEEIVVDKAKVEQVLTLFKNTDTNILSVGIGGGTIAPTVTEGLYIAPKANSADGVAEAFPEGSTPNWPTLGSKVSKFIPKNKTVPKNHPSARMGFVLASPVLFLQEGKRRVTFTLTCELNPTLKQTQVPLEFEKIFDELRNRIGDIFYVISEEALKISIKDGLSPSGALLVESWLQQRNPYTTWSDQEPCPEAVNACGTGSNSTSSVCVNQHWKTAEALINTLPATDIPILKKHTRRTIFHLLFSGEKEWISINLDDPANYSVSIAGTDLSSSYNITIVALLTPDQPGVTFFNQENLKEALGTDLPVAKFELDPDIKLWCPNAPTSLVCCLENCTTAPGAYVSPWHLFGNSIITASKIEVAVCGVRNLVVQNDENVQDVNSPIFPFGTRPEVPGFSVVEEPLPDPNQTGPNFYIGSREIFLKQWETVYVNLEWKDLPIDFGDHYYAYTNTPKIDKIDFKIKASILEEGNWIKETIPPPGSPRELFTDDDVKLDLCDAKGSTIQTIFVTASNFPPAVPQYFHPEIKLPLSPLNTASRNGFLSFQLYGQDFLHRDYPFVLARQMLAFGKYPNVKDVPGAVLKFLDPNNPPPAPEDLLKEVIDQLLADMAGTLKDLLDLVTPSTVYPNNVLAADFTQVDEPPVDGNFVARFNDGLDDVVQLVLDQLNLIRTTADALAITDIPPIIANLVALRNFLDGVVVGGGDILAANVPALLTDVINILDGMQGHVAPIPPLIDPTPPPAPFDQPAFDIDGIFRYNDGVDDKANLIQSEIDGVIPVPAQPNLPNLQSVKARIDGLKTFLFTKRQEALSIQNGGVPIPFEPYTPTLKYISLDYTATANSADVGFIHLHPYADTFKIEFYANTPTLVATPPLLGIPGTDPTKFAPAEGTLYLGLKNLIPGSNLNLLFQLAEATANTDADKALITWQYLSNNGWRELREGFEVLDDATKGLTTSGIVKIAVPPDITNGPENTVLPRGLHWLKVATLANSRAVCETLGIYTQAVRATYAPDTANDPARSGKPLEAGKLAKLREADANVKQVQQPYESFGGRAAEDAGGSKTAFYRRAAEQLRHKGRAIAPFDYERLVLEAFPEIYKVKCISHTMALGAVQHRTDLEWAAGFVTLVVIPDLTLLKTGVNLSPRASISLLERIQEEVCRRSSPFARIRVFNPRYEEVRVSIRVVLNKGFDQVYYEAQLKQDIIYFLAPWHLGDSEKLRFGQPIYRSDLLKYVEQLPYVDYVTELKMAHEQNDAAWQAGGESIVDPKTARSILTAGTVTVCPGDDPHCPSYTKPPCGPGVTVTDPPNINLS